MSVEPCPCGSGRAFAVCCGAILSGGAAVTAEALMRSRFTAFARGDAAYLLRSWHPSTRPGSLDVDPEVQWRRLQIVDTVRGGEHDEDGVVEFRASFRGPEGAGLLHERSRFVRVGGRWVYVDGEVS
ncbi:YchJ family protein [Homoserinibacter sp. GY 40078]|uniref:YchJ family protein n=1 Tax=Homoserinibacter sp. GY 40078 TaxID=2603275 RepID=UPI0011CB389D|nr:YchJ family metal-binding protein [Homoserinibacter sp. GY 40078]TXK17035.1 hypothetical protein FVQ89_09120 [Homoserinibacter sp. GY 40078]